MAECIAIVVVPRDRLSMFPASLDALYAHTHGDFRIVVAAGCIDQQLANTC
jgi:hypothetical protein